MGLFDGLDDIEKIGGLEAANEQLKKDVVDWIMKTYFNDNSDLVCEIDESNGWFRVMRNGTLVITGDYVGVSIMNRMEKILIAILILQVLGYITLRFRKVNLSTLTAS